MVPMTIDAKYIGLTTNQLAKIASDLKAENKKLRRELDFYKAQIEPVDEDNRRLRERWQEALAENGKLRKVAKDMYPSYCYANGGNGENYLTYEQDADIRDRVRELGVLDK